MSTHRAGRAALGLLEKGAVSDEHDGGEMVQGKRATLDLGIPGEEACDGALVTANRAGGTVIAREIIEPLFQQHFGQGLAHRLLLACFFTCFCFFACFFLALAVYHRGTFERTGTPRISRKQAKTRLCASFYTDESALASQGETDFVLPVPVFCSESAEQHKQRGWQDVHKAEAHRALTAIVASKFRRGSLRGERERHKERRALPCG
jgi:hypothetical protein